MPSPSFRTTKAALLWVFKTHHPINHMDTGLLEGSCPADVAFFIKTSFEFHQDSHLFASFGGLQQRFHNGRVLSDPVEGLFDGQHLRVTGGCVQEIHHRGERIVGMVKEDIFLPDGIEEFTGEVYISAADEEWQVCKGDISSRSAQHCYKLARGWPNPTGHSGYKHRWF